MQLIPLPLRFQHRSLRRCANTGLFALAATSAALTAKRHDALRAREVLFVRMQPNGDRIPLK